MYTGGLNALIYRKFTSPVPASPEICIFWIDSPSSTSKTPEGSTVGDGAVALIEMFCPLGVIVVHAPFFRFTVPDVEFEPFTVIADTDVPCNPEQFITRFCAVPPFVHPVPAATVNTPEFEIVRVWLFPDNVIPSPSDNDKTPVFDRVGNCPLEIDNPVRTKICLMLNQLATST